MSWSYADNLKVDPATKVGDVETLIERIQEIGAAKQSGDPGAIWFEVEAEDLWELRGLVENLVDTIEDYVRSDYVINRDCIQEVEGA